MGTRDSNHLERLPLDPERFAHTLGLMHRVVDSGGLPGVAFGYWDAREPGRVFEAAFGRARVEPSAQALTLEHFFDLASLTKPLVGALLAARMVDRGWLRWNTPVREILSDFPERVGEQGTVQVAHLLSHTAGFEAHHPFYEALRKHGSLPEFSRKQRMQWMREELRRHPPLARAGERALYSDLSFLWLTYALETLSGERVDQSARPLFELVGADGLHFRLTEALELKRVALEEDRYTATEKCPWRGVVLQGQVHDDNCWSMGGVSAHAGLFGRLSDVLTMASALYGKQLLSGEVRSAWWSRVAEPAGCSRTLGWDTPAPTGSLAGDKFSSWAVGHTGFTGVSLWMDLHRGVAVSLLTQRVHPSRDAPGPQAVLKELRPAIHDAFWGDWS